MILISFIDKNRRLLWLALLFASLAAAQAIGLQRLPYSTSLIEAAAVSDAGPSNGLFQVGSVRWVVAAFESDPSLEPYRKIYASSCGGTRGLAATIRVSDEFATRFPHGAPRDEFLFRGYDPVRELDAHLGGKAGHCVTRAGLVATTLLAAGIPARVLQVIPPDSKGHNIVEVWDHPRGWVLFDPTTGSAFGRRGRAGEAGPYLSAAEAARAPGGILAVALGKMPANVGDAGVFISPRFFEGALIYPEPWLYSRVGPRYSYWPYGGRFVNVGAVGWRTGRLQVLLRLGIGLCLLGSMAEFGAYCYASVRRLRAALAASRPKAVAVANRAGPTTVGRPGQPRELWSV